MWLLVRSMSPSFSSREAVLKLRVSMVGSIDMANETLRSCRSPARMQNLVRVVSGLAFFFQTFMYIRTSASFKSAWLRLRSMRLRSKEERPSTSKSPARSFITMDESAATMRYLPRRSLREFRRTSMSKRGRTLTSAMAVPAAAMVSPEASMRRTSSSCTSRGKRSRNFPTEARIPVLSWSTSQATSVRRSWTGGK